MCQELGKTCKGVLDRHLRRYRMSNHKLHYSALSQPFSLAGSNACRPLFRGG